MSSINSTVRQLDVALSQVNEQQSRFMDLHNKMKIGVVHQTKIYQAQLRRFHPFCKETNKQFHRDPVQNTEAIGCRLIQLMMAKFHYVLCDKDSAVSETNQRETKQLFQKLRQLHPQDLYCKQSVPADHSQCRTLDDICFALHSLRCWSS